VVDGPVNTCKIPFVELRSMLALALSPKDSPRKFISKLNTEAVLGFVRRKGKYTIDSNKFDFMPDILGTAPRRPQRELGPLNFQV